MCSGCGVSLVKVYKVKETTVCWRVTVTPLRLRGLRLPEDEIINIKSKLQDRAEAGQNAIKINMVR